MKIYLKQDVKGQGKKGQIVEVSDGYARNFLLPKGLGVIADAKLENEVKNSQSSQAYRQSQELAAAKELAAKGAAHGTTVIAESQTGGKGRLGRSFVSPFAPQMVNIGFSLHSRLILVVAKWPF